MQYNMLKENTEIVYKGKEYVVLRKVLPKVILKETDVWGDGKIIDEDFSSLISDKTFSIIDRSLKVQLKNDERTYNSILDLIPEKKRQQATSRFNIIRPLILLKGIREGDPKATVEFIDKYKSYLKPKQIPRELTQFELLKLISKRHKISTRQLRRYLDNYQKGEIAENGGGIEALLPQKVICNSRNDERILVINHPKKKDLVLDEIKVRLPEEYLPIIKEVLEKAYLTPQKISKMAAVNMTKAICTKASLDTLPPITIYKIIDKIDPTVIARMREGKAVNQSLKLISQRFTNEEALFPLHIVEIDHYKVPIYLIEENTGEVIYGAWLTMGICLYSRAIWCFHLSFDAPSSTVTRKALEHGIFPKDSKEKYDTLNEWPVFGIPQIIHLDNGSDFRSKEIRTLVNTTLKSQLRYRPVATPNYGGAIESCFGNQIKEFIETLDGSFKKRKQSTTDYDPQKAANLTLEQLRKLLILHIVDVYHNKVHSELPYNTPSPILRYYEGCNNVGEPPWVSKHEEQSLRYAFLPVEEKRITREGITFKTIIYSSEALADYVGTGKKYKIKYDNDDISKIFLLQPDGTTIEIPAVHPPAESIKGMNRYTYGIVRKNLIREGKMKLKEHMSEKMVNQSLSRIKDETEKAYNKNRNTRKQVTKMKGKISIDFHNKKLPNIEEPSLKELFQLGKKI